MNAELVERINKTFSEEEDKLTERVDKLDITASVRTATYAFDLASSRLENVRKQIENNPVEVTDAKMQECVPEKLLDQVRSFKSLQMTVPTSRYGKSFESS